MAQQKGSEVLLPNLGVYLNLPPIGIPDRALQDCRNVRIEEGQLTAFNVGWRRFSNLWSLNGPVKLIDNFFDSTGAQKLIFASTTDLYEWVEAGDTILYVTPRYVTGLASCAGTSSVTGSDGADWEAGEIKEGDAIHFGSDDQRNPTSAEQPAGPHATWYTIQSVGDATSITLTGNGPSTSGAVAYTIRRRLTGDENDLWSTELFNNGLPGPTDWWIGTNGTDPVLRWNGTDHAMEYVATGFTCKAIIKWYNMLLYGNLNVGGSARRTSIRNSDVGSPFDVSGGVAAELIAHDGVDEILAFFTIADSLIIYSIRNVTLATFVGLPELFAFRTSVMGIGPLAGNAIADFGDNHEWLGPDAAYIFDGVSSTEVNSHIMREVIRICPAARYNQIIVHFAEETGEVYWIIPQTSDASQVSPETAYSEHYLETVPESTPTPFTIRDLPATATGYFESLQTLTWDQLTTPWTTQNFRWDDRFFLASYPLNLFGKENGTIHIIGVADSQDGADITSFVEFGRRPVTDGKTRGCVKRVYVFATKLGSADHDLNVTVNTTDQLGGESIASVPLPYDLSHSGRRFVNPFSIGRFFNVKFSTTGVDHGWILQGYDVENAPLGERDAPA
jgi:hypothetical protein